MRSSRTRHDAPSPRGRARSAHSHCDDSGETLHKLLASSLVDASVLVDAGCGRGAHLAGTAGGRAVAQMRSSGGRVVGLDIDPDAAANPYVDEFHVLRDDSWPLPSACADIVFSDWVLEHVDRPEAFFRECGRVLRPGGVLVARTLQRWSPAGVGARAVPNRFHPWLGARLQPGMHEADIFPTRMRANTARTLTGLCAGAGLDCETHVAPGLGGYAAGSRWLGAALNLVERRLPPSMTHAIIIVARKRPISIR